MQRWLSILLLILAFVSLQTAAAAQVRDETGDALGPLKAPPGGKAYRVTWSGFWRGFVEVTVDADGRTHMRTIGPDDVAITVPLQPGDLSSFEAELAHSPFAVTPEHPKAPTCLDECSNFFLAVVKDGSSKTLPVDPRSETIEARRTRLHSGDYTLAEVADELTQLAAARSGDFRGRPAPWWTLEYADHPVPAFAGQRDGCPPGDVECSRTAWTAQLTSLGLSTLWTKPVGYPGESFYRLIRLPRTGSAQAILVDRDPSHCDMIVASPEPEVCKVHVRVDTTSQPRPRPVAVAQADRFEAALYAAGFSTLPSEPARRCVSGDSWVLEAYIQGRYRYVVGSTCDDRGLGVPVAELRQWAGWP